MSSAGRRRFRVVARPKERARRVRSVAALAAVAALGGVAFVTVRELAADFRLPAAARASAAPAEDAPVRVDGPEPLRGLAQAAADAAPGGAGEKAQALKAKFPMIADVRVARAWTEKTATLSLVTRRAIAPATRRGKPAGFLGDDGTVFAAPEGAFMLTGATVEVADAPAGELAALAREWPALTAAGALPSPLAEMSFRGKDDGWQARLEDGADVTWGRLEWTREKLARLSEAVADARAREPGTFSADLRWFEDGKVLLKPSQPKIAAHGALR
ncbi:MAG: cell division protein FtsQ [Elusimicrobiota bacterium]|nr:MAG: cell division protein FtsQ [Elusimicrobiota bacterium]